MQQKRACWVTENWSHFLTEDIQCQMKSVASFYLKTLKAFYQVEISTQSETLSDTHKMKH